MVKKTNLNAFPGPSARSFQGVKIGEDDALIRAHVTKGQDDILLVSRKGMAIRFAESDVRPMGLSAAGVYGMRLQGDKDWIVGSGIIRPRANVFIITEDGRGKRTALKEFPQQGRYGKGVLIWKSGDEANLVGATIGLASQRATGRLKKAAARSLRYSDAPKKSRTSLGVTLFKVRSGDRVVGLDPVILRPDIERAD
jgi:DNA gyrase subunit A